MQPRSGQMRKTRVLSACVAGAAAVTIVSAALGATTASVVKKPVVSGELVRNGGAESGGAATGSSTTVAPPGWTTTGNFTAVKYSAGGGFPDAAASHAISGGKQFFAGGPAAPAASATQVVAVPAAFSKAGAKVTAKLSAALGGFRPRRMMRRLRRPSSARPAPTRSTRHQAGLPHAERGYDEARIGHADEGGARRNDVDQDRDQGEAALGRVRRRLRRQRQPASPDRLGTNEAVGAVKRPQLVLPSCSSVTPRPGSSSVGPP